MADRKLPPKQEMFVAAYLQCFNATQAAIAAGYSAKNADKIGSELLGKTREIIDAKTQQLTKKAEVSQERLLAELVGLGLSNFGDYASWDAEGKVTIRPSEELTKDQKAAIQSIKSNTVSRTKDGETTTTHSLELKLYPKEGPLTKLGEKYGLFPKEEKSDTYNLQQNNFQRSTDPFPLENLTQEDRDQLRAIIAKAKAQVKVVGEGTGA